MNNEPKFQSRHDQCVSDLCAEVDYWKARALRAEREQKADLEACMREFREMYRNYVSIMALWGGKPEPVEVICE